MGTVLYCVLGNGTGSTAPALAVAPFAALHVAADPVGPSYVSTVVKTVVVVGGVLALGLGARYREAIKNFLYPKLGWPTQPARSKVSEAPTEAKADSNPPKAGTVARDAAGVQPLKTKEGSKFPTKLVVIISIVI